MKQITLNVPDHKYSFFIELVKNLGLEKVKEETKGDSRKGKIGSEKISGSKVASLRGKLQLSEEQYKDFHEYIREGRNEWSRGF